MVVGFPCYKREEKVQYGYLNKIKKAKILQK